MKLTLFKQYKKEQIYDLILERYTKYNYLTHNESKEEFINRMVEINMALIHSKDKFLNICEYFWNKFKNSLFIKRKQPFNDMVQYNCKLCCLLYGIPIEEIKIRYTGFELAVS